MLSRKKKTPAVRHYLSEERIAEMQGSYKNIQLRDRDSNIKANHLITLRKIYTP